MSKQDLDKFFPRDGPCPDHPTRYKRHWLVGEIRQRYRKGETICAMMDDYRLSEEAVKAAIRARADDDRMTKGEMREAAGR